MELKTIIDTNPLTFLQQVIDASNQGFKLSDKTAHWPTFHSSFVVTMVKGEVSENVVKSEPSGPELQGAIPTEVKKPAGRPAKRT